MTEINRTERMSISLREKQGERRLVRVEALRHEGEDCCGEVTYNFTFDEVNPLFKVGTVEKAVRALTVNTPWYNSSSEAPTWGRVPPRELEVVRVREIVEVEAVPYQLPVKFPDVIQTDAKTRRLCERYLGHSLPDFETSWQMRLVVIPDGESLGSLQARCINQAPVLIGRDIPEQYFSWGVIPVLEEYEPLTKGRAAAFLFTSTTRLDD